MHGTGYASLFLNPCASVYTQLGQSCSAATRLSLHIPPEQVVVDAAQQKLVKTFLQIWVSCVLLHMSYILDFLTQATFGSFFVKAFKGKETGFNKTFPEIIGPRGTS